MSHYHLYNISTESATALTHLLSTLAFLAENFIFLYLGVSVVAYSSFFNWDWGFIFFSMLICLISRALNIFPLCALANFGRKTPIPFSHMVVIWFSGLRGAIAFSLALSVKTTDKNHAAVIKSSTLFTVMFTTLVFGLLTSPLLQYFELNCPSNSGTTASHEDSDAIELQNLMERQNSTDSVVDGKSNNTASNSPSSTTSNRSGAIHSIWEKVDEEYLKPVFGGNPRRDQVGLTAYLLTDSEKE